MGKRKIRRSCYCREPAVTGKALKELSRSCRETFTVYVYPMTVLTKPGSFPQQEGEIRVNMNLLFLVAGPIGGLLCCVGDVLFDLKGNGNQKLGTSKNIDSNWLKMAKWRFGASIMLATVGDICIAIAVLIGALAVPKWMAVLNSVIFLLIGWVFRAINPKKFQDLPGIIMPSPGLEMVGLIGIFAIL